MFIAKINSSSPRYLDWVNVFGGDHAPIVSDEQSVQIILGQLRPVYFLDLRRLRFDQIEKLIDHIANKFEVTKKEVERDLFKIGVPILIEDIEIISPNNN